MGVSIGAAVLQAPRAEVAGAAGAAQRAAAVEVEEGLLAPRAGVGEEAADLSLGGMDPPLLLVHLQQLLQLLLHLRLLLALHLPRQLHLEQAEAARGEALKGSGRDGGCNLGVAEGRRPALFGEAGTVQLKEGGE